MQSPVAHDVADDAADFGVLVCGTGIGMAMAADKVPGVRAANIINPEFAALCREHNDANVITLSGRFVPLEENERILDTFFATDFGGGRHAGRVQEDNAVGLVKETIDGFGISHRRRPAGDRLPAR